MCDTFTGGMDIFWYRGIEKSLRRRFDAGGSLLLFFLPDDPLIGGGYLLSVSQSTIKYFAFCRK